jgi:hypothetical protein
MDVPTVKLCACGKQTACLIGKRVLAQQLYESIGQNLAAVKRALDDGVNPDIGLTAGLHYSILLAEAAQVQNIDMVRLRLQGGAQLRICDKLRNNVWHTCLLAANQRCSPRRQGQSDSANA